MQFWVMFASQSVTDGPPEQFWDTAGLKTEHFVQFAAHLGAFGVHFGSIFGRLCLQKPVCSLSKTSIFKKSGFLESGGVLTTFLVTLSWLGPLLSSIFGLPGRSLERSRHSWGVAGTPQEGISTLPGRSSTAYGCSRMLKKWPETRRKQFWLTLGRSPTPLGAFLMGLYIKIHAFWSVTVRTLPERGGTCAAH